MGLFEKDQLIRLLEELTKRRATIARLLAGGQPGEALSEIDGARATLAGPLAGTLERVDGGTIVALLGVEKARAYAELARLEADARRALGDTARAEKVSVRAEEIARAI